MTLRLIYLLATRICVLLRLAARDSTAKNVEILFLRHQSRSPGAGIRSLPASSLGLNGPG